MTVAAFPLKPETRWLEIAGARVAYGASGAGEPVVALHCSASSGGQWAALGNRLAPRFRLLTPDAFGNGRSQPWPGGRALTLADEAEVVRALAERAGRPVHLVGHSYGGGVALRAAYDMPDQVASLTLYEPSAFHLLAQGIVDRPVFQEIVGQAQAVARAAAAGEHERGMRLFFDYWNRRGSFDALEEGRRAALAARLAHVAPHYPALFAERPAAEDYAARLSMPVLLLSGDASPAPSRRICRLLAEALPDARLETVAGVGHMAPLTHPERIAGFAAAFIEEMAEAAAGWRTAAE